MLSDLYAIKGGTFSEVVRDNPHQPSGRIIQISVQAANIDGIRPEADLLSRITWTFGGFYELRCRELDSRLA